MLTIKTSLPNFLTKAAQTQIEQTLTPSNTKQQDKSEAQQATQQRNLALEALNTTPNTQKERKLTNSFLLQITTPS